MKLGILGYGRMGQAVEKQAIARGHSRLILSGEAWSAQLDAERPDCVIDFTHATFAPEAIITCFRAGIPVVSGTTGWNAGLDEIRAQCVTHDSAFCWSPNFSVGMHIVFHLNRELARVMQRFAQYDPEIVEVHHTGKKDSPSGTAIALAEQIIDRLDRKAHWVNHQADAPDTLGIVSQREADVKGTHTVSYRSDEDSCILEHRAFNREGFALGAVIAAEWLPGKKGNFRFEDVLALSDNGANL